jgi:diguanylate cyclase (GGDEF)-like protein
MRILIADDDRTSRAALAAVLRKMGHEVVETADGPEALNQMSRPDAPLLAVLDWMMPGMDGIELVRKIRDMRSALPPYLILLTSRRATSDIITGLDAGANDYLSKPFNPGELSARVRVGSRMIELQSQLIKTQNALEHEATHDYLTGILNRRAIEGELSRELSRHRRDGMGLVVAICDIDHFKQINDNYGHAVGDEVLCGVVRLMQSCLRDYDRIGRTGGEEFLVISPGIQDVDARGLFERLRMKTEATPIKTGAGEIRITLSIGVKIADNGDDTIEKLTQAADTALYMAKEKGRNRLCVYEAPA